MLVELERTPGVNGKKTTVVYRGKGASFIDRTVRDGVRYRYEIKASDVAGNMVQKAVTANVDLPALYRPAAGAVVHAPLVLSWEAVKGATFYNVQLYRNKVKVLTFWPKHADLPDREDVALRRQAPAARAGPVRLVCLGGEGDPRQAAVRKAARQQLVRRQVALPLELEPVVVVHRTEHVPQHVLRDALPLARSPLPDRSGSARRRRCARRSMSSVICFQFV